MITNVLEFFIVFYLIFGTLLIPPGYLFFRVTSFDKIEVLRIDMVMCVLFPFMIVWIVTGFVLFLIGKALGYIYEKLNLSKRIL